MVMGTRSCYSKLSSDKNYDSGDNVFAVGLSVIKGNDSTHDFKW